MAKDRTLTKEELLTLIADRHNDPDLSGLPYREQQDVVDDPNHPIRQHMAEREKAIQIGLKELGLEDYDLSDPDWEL